MSAPPDEVRVVHRDAELVVVDKPSGLPTTAPDGGDCLVERVRALFPEGERMHPTSRLDAEVTGLVTFARTSRATEALLAARARGAYRRRYAAIAVGVWTHPDASRVVDARIAIDPHDPRKRRALGEDVADAQAKEARSTIELVASSRGTIACWLFPHTGRTHQLRVHLAHIGHPILGDIHYGGPRRLTVGDGRVVSFKRVLLHCAELYIPNVARGGELRLVAPLPADWLEAAKRLGFEVGPFALSPQ